MPCPRAPAGSLRYAVFAAGLDGVACRSAARGGNEELAYFVRDVQLVPGKRIEFHDWYWSR